MLKKLQHNLQKIGDNDLLTPSEIVDLGLILNVDLEPSLPRLYRMLKKDEIPFVNMGTPKAPIYYIKGKDIREYVTRKYNL